MNWRGMWKEAVMTYFKYYSSICFEGLRRKRP